MMNFVKSFVDYANRMSLFKNKWSVIDQNHGRFLLHNPEKNMSIVFIPKQIHCERSMKIPEYSFDIKTQSFFPNQIDRLHVMNDCPQEFSNVKTHLNTEGMLISWPAGIQGPYFTEDERFVG